jgi:hypothetical protein
MVSDYSGKRTTTNMVTALVDAGKTLNTYQMHKVYA